MAILIYFISAILIKISSSSVITNTNTINSGKNEILSMVLSSKNNEKSQIIMFLIDSIFTKILHMSG